MDKIDYPKVGIGVTVILAWNNQILLAKRQGSHGAGDWDTPGGHLEPGETVIDCAIRETDEETGIQLQAQDLREIGFTEDFFLVEKKHYISCVVYCQIDGDKHKAIVREPAKFSTPWSWHAIATLPTPLFIPIQNAFKKYPLLRQRSSTR